MSIEKLTDRGKDRYPLGASDVEVGKEAYEKKMKELKGQGE